MRHFARKDFKWKDSDLQFNGETLFSVVKDERGMFRVRWPDGVLSQDAYNITWAKEHCVELALEIKKNNTLDSE